LDVVAAPGWFLSQVRPTLFPELFCDHAGRAECFDPDKCRRATPGRARRHAPLFEVVWAPLHRGRMPSSVRRDTGDALCRDDSRQRQQGGHLSAHHGEADHEHSTPVAGADTHSRGPAGGLTGAPVIGRIDRMRIGPPPRRAGAAPSTIQMRARASFFLTDHVANRQQHPQLGVDGADVAHARSLGRRASTSTSPSKRTWPSAVNCPGIKKRVPGHRAFRAPPRLVDGVAGGAGWRSRRGSSSSAAAAERAGR
jgi:hypothetical protein